jgi:peptidoglycan L-alanyl-D-glutamate endopeptidase CwlK
MNSRHLPGKDGKSRAVDIAPLDGGQVSWAWPHYIPLAKVMQKASAELGIPIRWGGTWKLLSDTPEISSKVLSRSFPDGPHFELPVKFYP